MQNHKDTASHQLLRRKQLEKTIGLSRSTIYARLDVNSPYYDPTFPKPISLGARSVGWLESDIQAWIDSRITADKAA